MAKRCLKKNLNASLSIPQSGGKMSKRLVGAGIIGCKDKTSPWHLNGFPSGVTSGQQLFNRVISWPSESSYRVLHDDKETPCTG